MQELALAVVDIALDHRRSHLARQHSFMSMRLKEAHSYEIDRALLDCEDADRTRAILMTDAALLVAVQRSSGSVSGLKAGALISEAERRGLNVR